MNNKKVKKIMLYLKGMEGKVYLFFVCFVDYYEIEIEMKEDREEE